MKILYVNEEGKKKLHILNTKQDMSLWSHFMKIWRYLEDVRGQTTNLSKSGSCYILLNNIFRLDHWYLNTDLKGVYFLNMHITIGILLYRLVTNFSLHCRLWDGLNFFLREQSLTYIQPSSGYEYLHT